MKSQRKWYRQAYANTEIYKHRRQQCGGSAYKDNMCLVQVLHRLRCYNGRLSWFKWLWTWCYRWNTRDRTHLQNGNFSIWRFHKWSVNIKNPIKHQNTDINAAGERSARVDLIITEKNRWMWQSVTFLQIAVDFNAEHQQVTVCEPFNETSSTWTFRGEAHTHVLFLTAWHQALSLARIRQHRQWNADDWKHDAWSDESCFQLYR